VNRERQNGGEDFCELTVNRERQNRGKIAVNILLQNPQTSPAKSSPSLLPRPRIWPPYPGWKHKEREAK